METNKKENFKMLSEIKAYYLNKKESDGFLCNIADNIGCRDLFVNYLKNNYPRQKGLNSTKEKFLNEGGAVWIYEFESKKLNWLTYHINKNK